MKPLELLLPRNIINRKQYLIPGTISEISATIKDLKDARVVIPITSPLTCLFGLWRRQINLEESQWVIVSLTR